MTIENITLTTPIEKNFLSTSMKMTNLPISILTITLTYPMQRITMTTPIKSFTLISPLEKYYPDKKFNYPDNSKNMKITIEKEIYRKLYKMKKYVVIDIYWG